MFDLRLEEIPLPAGKKDRDNLISWLIDTLCLHRRREDSASDESGTFSQFIESLVSIYSNSQIKGLKQGN